MGPGRGLSFPPGLLIQQPILLPRPDPTQHRGNADVSPPPSPLPPLQPSTVSASLGSTCPDVHTRKLGHAQAFHCLTHPALGKLLVPPDLITPSLLHLGQSIFISTLTSFHLCIPPHNSQRGRQWAYEPSSVSPLPAVPQPSTASPPLESKSSLQPTRPCRTSPVPPLPPLSLCSSHRGSLRSLQHARHSPASGPLHFPLDFPMALFPTSHGLC